MTTVRNITFHGIGTPPVSTPASERKVWVDRVRYEATLDAAARRPSVVRISFDDGNDTDFEVALPGLLARGLTATFFVVADRIDGPGYLSAGQIGELAAAGMTIGFHGLSHRRWPALDDGELVRELRDGHALLEETLGQKVGEASCPFGEYDLRVLRALRQQGFRRVFTSDGGRARAGAWLQARTSFRAGADPSAVVEGLQPFRRNQTIRVVKTGVKRLRLRPPHQFAPQFAGTRVRAGSDSDRRV